MTIRCPLIALVLMLLPGCATDEFIYAPRPPVSVEQCVGTWLSLSPDQGRRLELLADRTATLTVAEDNVVKRYSAEHWRSDGHGVAADFLPTDGTGDPVALSVSPSQESSSDSVVILYEEFGSDFIREERATDFMDVLLFAPAAPVAAPSTKDTSMELGNFSVSLTVKDLQASRAFYEKLGFRQVGGDAAQNWLVLQNSTAVIGLFQGMFERNMLTFNPGWDRNRQTPASFDDVRDLQKRFKELGLKLELEADPASTGPASLMLHDPDGNPILIDQHVAKPKP